MGDCSSNKRDWKSLRNKVIGLGEGSLKKSYYPELEESEARFKAIFNSVNDAIFVQDAKTGRIIDANQRACELYGYSYDEIINIKIGMLSEGIAPYDDEISVEKIRKAAAGEAQIFEWQAKKKDGTLFWVEVSLLLAEINEHNEILSVARDITERKKTNEALRESERRLSDIIDFLPDATFAIDLDGKVIIWNKAVEELTGVKANDMIGKSNYEYGLAFYGKRMPLLIDTLRGITLKDEFLQFAEQQNSVVAERYTPIIRDGGAYLWGKTSPLYDPDEKIIGYIESVRDVTDRKLSEDALKESTQMMQLVLDTVPARVFWKDRNSVFRGCSRLLAYDAGVNSPSEMIGKTDFDMPWKDTHAQKYQDDDKYVMETGKSKLSYQETQYNAEGRTIWLTSSKVPLRDATGNIIGVLGTYEDITERKQAEDDLRESQRTLATLLSNLPGMAYRCWNDPNWTMQFVSEGCAELTGYPKEALINNARISFGALIHPEDRETVWKEVQNSLAENRPFRHVYRIYTASGKVKWVWEQGRGVYSDSGELLALEGLVTDITEQKLVDEEKRAFYRETVRSVTQGKLDLVSYADIERYINAATYRAAVQSPQDTAIVRQQVEIMLSANKLKGDEMGLFLTGLGEAMTNALKHAQKGKVFSGANRKSVWVAVSDDGPGIETLTLPSATLRRGFSTKISMGMGYTIMIDVSDRVLLCTGHSGTTVVLEKFIEKSAPELSLIDLPDTWDQVSF